MPDVETRLRAVENTLAEMRGAANTLRWIQVLVAIAVGGLAVISYLRGPV